MERAVKSFLKKSLNLLYFFATGEKNAIQISKVMAYDSVSNPIVKQYNSYDYCRYRTLELVAEEIYRNNVNGNVAEAGVYLGDFSKIINTVFPDRLLYLYDTYEGFDESDKKKELEMGYTSKDFFSQKKDFHCENPDNRIEIVRQKMTNEGNCVFRKGYFPDSATDEHDEVFAFVSVDMDLYTPTLAALEFFYPRLSSGGYMFMHDYNHKEFLGIKDALREYEQKVGKIHKIPLPDEGGTIVITKIDG